MYKETKRHRLAGYNLLGMSFGSDQHIYSSSKGKISCVFLKNYLLDNRDFYEIYCLEGDLFEGVERFLTLKEAEEKVAEYLNISKSKLRMLRPEKVRKVKGEIR